MSIRSILILTSFIHRRWRIRKKNSGNSTRNWWVQIPVEINYFTMTACFWFSEVRELCDFQRKHCGPFGLTWSLELLVQNRSVCFLEAYCNLCLHINTETTFKYVQSERFIFNDKLWMAWNVDVYQLLLYTHCFTAGFKCSSLVARESTPRNVKTPYLVKWCGNNKNMIAIFP